MKEDFILFSLFIIASAVQGIDPCTSAHPTCDTCAADQSCMWCVGINCTGFCILNAITRESSVCRWSVKYPLASSCPSIDSCSLSVSQEPLKDPNFELRDGSWTNNPVGYSSIVWNSTTDHYPLEGEYFTFFGGGVENDCWDFFQKISISKSNPATHLSFYVWCELDPVHHDSANTLMALIDEEPIFVHEFPQEQTYYYVPVQLNISKWKDDSEHTFTFRFWQFGNESHLAPNVYVDSIYFLNSTELSNSNDGSTTESCSFGCNKTDTSICHPACNNPMCGYDSKCNASVVSINRCFNGAPVLSRTSMSTCSNYKDATCCRNQNYDSKIFYHQSELYGHCSGPSDECKGYLEEISCGVCSPHSSLFFGFGDLLICAKYGATVYSACKSYCATTATTTNDWFKTMGLGIYVSGYKNCFMGANADYTNPSDKEMWITYVAIFVPIGAVLILAASITLAVCLFVINLKKNSFLRIKINEEVSVIIYKKQKKQEKAAKAQYVPEGWVAGDQNANQQSVATQAPGGGANDREVPLGNVSSTTSTSTNASTASYVPEGWVGKE